MASTTKHYRCNNRAKCELARNRQTIEIGNGQRHTCPLGDPNCERNNLREIDAPQSGPPIPVIVGVVIAVLVIGAGVWFWLHAGGAGPSGQTVEAALKEVWPWLAN